MTKNKMMDKNKNRMREIHLGRFRYCINNSRSKCCLRILFPIPHERIRSLFKVPASNLKTSASFYRHYPSIKFFNPLPRRNLRSGRRVIALKSTVSACQKPSKYLTEKNTIAGRHQGIEARLLMTMTSKLL